MSECPLSVKTVLCHLSRISALVMQNAESLRPGTVPFLYFYVGLPGGSDSKESICNAEELGSIPGLGRSPGGGNVNPLQYSCLENFNGQRSLDSSECREELDTTD